MTSTVYTNAHIIDPANTIDTLGSLVTEDGIITAVGADVTSPKSAEIVECDGRILCPGFIDMRAHAVETEAALAGGITTLILQPDQTTTIDHDSAVERIISKAKASKSLKVYPMGAATKGMQGDEIAEIGKMLASGAVAITDCRKSIANAQVMRRLMEYSKYFDCLTVQFAQEPSLADNGVAHEGHIATQMGLNSIPAIAEAIQIERDALLAEATGARLHIALVSSRQGLKAIKAAKDRGVNITCSVAPHYLQLNHNAMEGYRTFAKVSPPLREEEDRLALIEALADGTIDTLVSDHDPRSADVKRLPFAQAATGVIGFETMLATALSCVHAGQITMTKLIAALTSNPAKILGLKSGNLAVGMAADITIFDPETPWKIEADKLISADKNTAFDTLPCQGKVWMTISDGTCVYKG